jgi:hypothetical protein
MYGRDIGEGSSSRAPKGVEAHDPLCPIRRAGCRTRNHKPSIAVAYQRYVVNVLSNYQIVHVVDMGLEIHVSARFVDCHAG